MTGAGDAAGWDTPPSPADETILHLDLDGYEGPIDVLLTLAREQKVDLTKIRILPLVDQYLAFIRRILHRRLEVAADYLVMAAWLAYLKSRLLLPDPPSEEAEPSAEEMAANLAFQLQRLEAMQKAGARLFEGALLGRDVFARGWPERFATDTKTQWDVSLYELLTAYADHKRRTDFSRLKIAATELYSMDDALQRLTARLGQMPLWEALSSFLPTDIRDGLVFRSAVAATFLAALELAKSGKLDLRQSDRFGPILVRSPGGDAASDPEEGDRV